MHCFLRIGPYPDASDLAVSLLGRIYQPVVAIQSVKPYKRCGLLVRLTTRRGTKRCTLRAVSDRVTISNWITCRTDFWTRGSSLEQPQIPYIKMSILESDNIHCH